MFCRKTITPRHCRRHAARPARALIAALASAALPVASLLTDQALANGNVNLYNGTTGNWSNSAKWSNGIPGDGDTALILPSAANTTVTFDPAAVGTNLAMVWIDGTNNSTVTLLQTTNSLTTT